MILQKSVASALCYDVRVNPEWVVAHAVAKLQAAVLEAAAAIYETSGPLLCGRAQLPGRYGGLTLRCGSSVESAAAYWASWSTHAGELPGLMAKLGWPVPGDPELGFAVAAAAELRVHVVDVGDGGIALTPAAAELYQAGPWAADTPVCEIFDLGEKTAVMEQSAHPDQGDDSDVWASLAYEAPLAEWGGQPAECAVRRRLLAKLLRGIDAVRATQLALALHPAGRTDMLSSGGPGCGTTWTQVPTRQEWRLTNSALVTATQQRLGALARPPCSTTCQIKDSEGNQCGAPLDSRMQHAGVCPHGTYACIKRWWPPSSTKLCGPERIRTWSGTSQSLCVKKWMARWRTRTWTL